MSRPRRRTSVRPCPTIGSRPHVTHSARSGFPAPPPPRRLPERHGALPGPVPALRAQRSPLSPPSPRRPCHSPFPPYLAAAASRSPQRRAPPPLAVAAPCPPAAAILAHPASVPPPTADVSRRARDDVSARAGPAPRAWPSSVFSAFLPSAFL